MLVLCINLRICRVKSSQLRDCERPSGGWFCISWTRCKIRRYSRTRRAWGLEALDFWPAQAILDGSYIGVLQCSNVLVAAGGLALRLNIGDRDKHRLRYCCLH